MDWFGQTVELSQEAEAFLEAVRQEAENWANADPEALMIPACSLAEESEISLLLGLDICDPNANCVVRTLRVEYAPSGLTYGEDETNQFVTELTQLQPSGCRPRWFARSIWLSGIRGGGCIGVLNTDWQTPDVGSAGRRGGTQGAAISMSQIA